MAARLPQKGFTTPAGRAVWPHLHAPDTEFDSAGVYSTGLTLSAGDALPIIEIIQQVQQETEKAVQAETKKKPKAAPYLPYEENEDGTYTFRFKMKASGTREDGTKWENAPALFDAAGGRVPKGTRIGGGSLIRINAHAQGYKAPFGVGVTLRLNAVQVIELQEIGTGSADDYGFSPVEGGFTSSAGDEEDDEFPMGGGDDDLPADF